MWYRVLQIAEWFGEMTERYRLIRDFNRAAKLSFITGSAPSLLEAKITVGESRYRHAFSKFLAGGFRIKALSGNPLSRADLIEIGRIIIGDEELTRKLVALGWDTLEIHSNHGFDGIKWALKDHVKIGGYIT